MNSTELKYPFNMMGFIDSKGSALFFFKSVRVDCYGAHIETIVKPPPQLRDLLPKF